MLKCELEYVYEVKLDLKMENEFNFLVLIWSGRSPPIYHSNWLQKTGLQNYHEKISDKI